MGQKPIVSECATQPVIQTKKSFLWLSLWILCNGIFSLHVFKLVRFALFMKYKNEVVEIR